MSNPSEGKERATLAQAIVTEKAKVAAPPSTSTFSMSDIEDAVRRVLDEAAKGRTPKPKPPKEPDWATLSEKDAFDPEQAVYIPVYDHQIPEYMNIELQDPEYVPVWGSTDQRRSGQLEAEGYELLKKEHIKKGFHLPLNFNSEGLYVYQDVVAYRVHKRIVFAKRRRYQQQTIDQLKPVMRMTNAIDNLINSNSSFDKGGIYDGVAQGKFDQSHAPRSGDIGNDPELARAFSEGSMSFVKPQSEV